MFDTSSSVGKRKAKTAVIIVLIVLAYIDALKKYNFRKACFTKIKVIPVIHKENPFRSINTG